MCIYEFSCDFCPYDDPDRCAACEFRPDDFFEEMSERSG